MKIKNRIVSSKPYSALLKLKKCNANLSNQIDEKNMKIKKKSITKCRNHEKHAFICTNPLHRQNNSSYLNYKNRKMSIYSYEVIKK